MLRKRTFSAFLSDPVEVDGTDALDESNRLEELNRTSLRNQIR